MVDGVPERLKQQLDFIIEVDKLKHVFRQTVLMDSSRRENDAEHSWHLALMAVLLAEHANWPDINLLKVIKMVLVHDIVEIDSGDTFCYDEEGYRTKAARENAAADRLFAILPEDQGEEIRALWEEFDARQSREARFAAALDRLQPMLHNYNTNGRTWQEHGVTSDQVMARNRHIAEGSAALWRYAEAMIHDAVEQGILATPESEGSSADQA